jgi:hypothetical protein
VLWKVQVLDLFGCVCGCAWSFAVDELPPFVRHHHHTSVKVPVTKAREPSLCGWKELKKRTNPDYIIRSDDCVVMHVEHNRHHHDHPSSSPLRFIILKKNNTHTHTETRPKNQYKQKHVCVGSAWLHGSCKTRTER